MGDEKLIVLFGDGGTKLFSLNNNKWDIVKQCLREILQLRLQINS